MTIYTVMSPPPSGNDARDAERVAFIKEGFSWSALFVPVIWLLWHRLWLVLAGYLTAAVVLSIAGGLIGGPAGGVVAVVLAVLFALEANALRRWTLERRGWQFAGIVSGTNREECETRFFHHWVEGLAQHTPKRLTAGTQHLDEGVLGLFPAPENTR